MRKLFSIDDDLLGPGPCVFEWSSKGKFLAACGQKRKVCILDRSGELYDELQLPSLEFNPESGTKINALIQWDPIGEKLAIIPSGNTSVLLWMASSKSLQKIETDFKTQEFTALAWSKDGQFLAMGTAKGNLLLYNCFERKKTPYVGKHMKKITCAKWTRSNHLALAGLDRMVTITDGSTGETVKSFGVRLDPNEMCISSRKEDGYGKNEENTYTLNLGGELIFLMEYNNGAESPMEVNLDPSYGPVQKHMWYGDGYILVTFRSGQAMVLSSHRKEIAEAVFTAKVLDEIKDAAYSASLGRIALGGGSSVRVLDTAGTEVAEIKQDAFQLDPGQEVEQVGWARDGQVLTVSTSSGQIQSFLASLPIVYDCYGSKVIYLTSLMEMSMMDLNKRGMILKVNIEAEPTFCGLGPHHLAVGMNNQVWFYRVGGRENGRLVNKREYLETVSAIKLNATHAAVLGDGKVIVHPIEAQPGGSPDEQDKVLPANGQGQTLSCMTITDSFIVTGSKQGIITYYFVIDYSLVKEFKHSDGGIVRLFPQPQGVRMIFEDDQSGIKFFNPVNDQVMDVPYGTGKRPDSIMWDLQEPNLFAIAEQQKLHVMMHRSASISGVHIEHLDTQSIASACKPLTLSNGILGCRIRNGPLDAVVLETHRLVHSNEALAKSEAPKRFKQCLKLGRLKDAWDSAVFLKNADCWRQLGKASMELLDVEMAMSAFRMVGDASMVLSLDRIKYYEDKNLLAGHMLVLLDGDANQAQESFLRSAYPKAALDMRIDLKQWSQALKLAEKLDPDNVAFICKEHAASLEMIGEYVKASTHYQQALESLAVASSDLVNSPDAQGVGNACKAGLSRCAVQMGDIRQGRTLALQLKSQLLFKELASILEGLSQRSEAAEMYERAGQLERAVDIYIQAKNFNAATPLMGRISSSRLQRQFAKAKESEGRYADAAVAYEAAGDLDAVVRLALGALNTPQRAFAIVRKTRSVDAAWDLAQYCLGVKDFAGAVEFLLLAGRMDKAFDIAQLHHEMDTFARIVMVSDQPTDYNRIAQYYENKEEYDKAGDMWCAAENFQKAAAVWIKVPDGSTLDKVIRVVEHTHDSMLCTNVIDYVERKMELEDSAKEEALEKLCIAMGRYQDAAKTAMKIANNLQNAGNYRAAHDKLFNSVRQMESLDVKPSQELLRCLLLLHSYTLVKSLISVSDHMNAARMLVRVARSISRFPMHIVPILTSTIIECNRAGLRKTAFEYAAMLMRPEYRDQVAIKYKKKIELMVRKPEKDAEDVEEHQLSCMFCGMPGSETDLQCFNCQNIIPFDIATGRRMTQEDWAECPSCHFPCSYEPFLRIVRTEQRCPMCSLEVLETQVRRVTDPLARVKKREEAYALGAGAKHVSNVGSTSGVQLMMYCNSSIMKGIRVNSANAATANGGAGITSPAPLSATSAVTRSIPKPRDVSVNGASRQSSASGADRLY